MAAGWFGVAGDAYLPRKIAAGKMLHHFVEEDGNVLCGRVKPDSMSDDPFHPGDRKCPRCERRLQKESTAHQAKEPACEACGGTREIECPSCLGIGTQRSDSEDKDSPRRKCFDCRGTRTVECLNCHPNRCSRCKRLRETHVTSLDETFSSGTRNTLRVWELCLDCRRAIVNATDDTVERPEEAGLDLARTIMAAALEEGGYACSCRKKKPCTACRMMAFVDGVRAAAFHIRRSGR